MQDFAFAQGSTINDVRKKSRKIPLCSQNIRTGSAPCPCGHTINFEKLEVFFTKKCERPHLKNPPCSQNVRTGQTSSPLTADVFYGHWTASYPKAKLRKNKNFPTYDDNDNYCDHEGEQQSANYSILLQSLITNHGGCAFGGASGAGGRSK